MYSIKSSLDIIIYFTDIKINNIVWLKLFKALLMCINNFELLISTIYALIMTSKFNENSFKINLTFFFL